MRASRLLVAVLAFALFGLVPAATATAAPASPSAERVAPLAPVSARVTKLTAKIVKRNGKLFFTGVIRPKKGPVVIKKATNCNADTGRCNFKQFAKKKINKKGRYTVRVSAPRNGSFAWQASKGKRTSEIWLTCTKRPGETCPVP